MLIYVIVSCPQAQGEIICVYNENCIFINVIVFYFVFSAVFIGEGQNLTNYIPFWLYVCTFVFFHTILTVAQNTRMSFILST